MRGVMKMKYDQLYSVVMDLTEAKKLLKSINKDNYKQHGSIGTLLLQTYGESAGKLMSTKFLSFGKSVCMSNTWEPVSAKKKALIKAIDEILITKSKQKSRQAGGNISWLQAEKRLESFNLFGGGNYSRK